MYPVARQAFLLITNEEQKIRKYSLLIHPNENQLQPQSFLGESSREGVELMHCQ